MDKKTKRVIVPFLILVIGLVLLLAVKNTSKTTTKFSIKAITSTTPSNPSWAAGPCTEDLADAFNQKFTYLATGGQCFVFLSEDRHYVLKFFRQGKFSKPLIGDKGKKLRKKQSAFVSYKIAYEKMKEETGLLLLHLVANDGFQHQVTLIDQEEKAHTIELGKFEFLLQKAASPLLSALEKMKSDGDLDKAKEMIDELFALLEHRQALGIGDFDPAIASNFGLIEGSIRQIDVGRFLYIKDRNQLERNQKEFRRKNLFFASWLEQNYPELYPYYLEKSDSLESVADRLLADLIAGGTG